MSLLKKIGKGKIDAIKYAQALKKDGKVSEDIWPLVDEMYLQKFEEYFGGEFIGSDENGELYKVACSSHVIKSSPEITMLRNSRPEVF